MGGDIIIINYENQLFTISSKEISMNCEDIECMQCSKFEFIRCSIHKGYLIRR